MLTLLSPTGTTGRTRVLLGVLPVLGVLAAAPLWHLWRRGYWWVVAEDLLAELLTVAAYAVTAVLAAVVARRLHRRGLRLESGLYVLVALGAFVIAGEELSWGQRQLGFAGPQALVERNLQGEANVHNVLGRYSAGGVVFDALHMLYMVLGLYGAVLGRRLVPYVPRLGRRPWLFAPQADLAPWFGACLAYYVWFDYLNPVLVALFGPGVDVERLTGPKLQESAELALAVGVLLFVARLAVRRHPDESPDVEQASRLADAPAR